MKIGRIVTDEGPKTVLISQGKYYDIEQITGEELSNGNSFFYFLSKNRDKLLEFIRSGQDSNQAEVAPNSFLLPLPFVNQIRDFYAFEEHVRNARRKRNLEVAPEWYEFPAYYYSGNSSLYPSGSEIPHPTFTSELDYELEIAAIIGKEGRNIAKGNAWEHIFGFVMMNDWSARDLQRKEMAIGLGPSKSKDFATSFAEYLVTADEVEQHLNPSGKINSEVWVQVNGKEYARNNIDTMHWSFQELISWASTDATLRQGDIIMSGTVGRGCILELPSGEFPWLSPGDSVIFGSELFGKLSGQVA